MEDKFYNVTELVDLIGAPRTTINDWLARYVKYIAFETRGKRRLYPESSVTVLREISELRNQGKTSFEIEEILMQNHPLQPDPVDLSAAAAPEPSGDNSDSGNSSALVLRSQTEEIAKLINRELRHMSERMDGVNKLDERVNHSVKRLYWPLATGFILLIFLLVFSSLFLSGIVNQLGGQQLEAQRSVGIQVEATKNSISEVLTRESSSSRTELLQRLSELQTLLVQNQELYQSELTKIRSEQLQERKQLSSELQKERENQQNIHQQQQEILTRNFQEKIAVLNEQLQQLKNTVSQKEAQIASLQEQISAQTQVIQNLSTSGNSTLQETLPETTSYPIDSTPESPEL